MKYVHKKFIKFHTNYEISFALLGCSNLTQPLGFWFNLVKPSRCYSCSPGLVWQKIQEPLTQDAKLLRGLGTKYNWADN